MSNDIEKNLEIIRENLITNFQNELNSILNSTVSDLEFTVNQLNRNIKSNLSSDNEINDFDFKIKNRILLANNSLDVAKQKFSSDIKEHVFLETNKFKTFIDSKSKTVQEELQQALYQINQSENHAITHLEDTYDLGVETIVSAEKTSLENLKKLTKELSEQLNIAVEEVEKIISEKLDNALLVIKKLENDSISNLNKVAINIQRDLENIKEQFVVEIQEVIKRFELTLENHSNKLKQELTAHKDKLQDELILEKELVFIELDKEKNNIIQELYILKNEYCEEINQIAEETKAKVEELRKELANMTEQRYSVVLTAGETLIQLPKTFTLNDRVKVYIDGLMHIKEDGSFTINKLERQITLSEPYKADVNVVVLAELPDYNIEAIKEQLYIDGEKYKNDAIKLIQDTGAQGQTTLENHITDGIERIENKVVESVDSVVGEFTSRIESYLQTLVEQKHISVLEKNSNKIKLPETFVLTPRIRVFVDGEILIPNVNYTLDGRLKEITLNNTYKDPVNVLVLDDFPDENIEELKQQMYKDGEVFKAETLGIITQKKDAAILEVENRVNNCVDTVVDEVNQNVMQYMTNLKEQKFKFVLTSNSTVVELPENYILYHRTRVFIDGKLAIPEDEYTIDHLTKTINIVTPVDYDRFIYVTDEYPSTDILELKKVLFQQLEAEKDNMINTIKQQTILEINKMIEKNNQLIDDSKQEIHTFTETYKERSYSIVLNANQTILNIPKDSFPLSIFAKVYIDGILQKNDLNYTIDLDSNTITLTESFSYDTDISIYDNIQTPKSN